MKAGIGALAGIEEMTADAFSAAGDLRNSRVRCNQIKSPEGMSFA